MAQKMICPRCKKPSYTAAPDDPSPCPYCGFVFCNDTKEPLKDNIKEDCSNEE